MTSPTDADKDHDHQRLRTFIRIMNECASNDKDEMPDAIYEALEESAARAAGFRNAEEARETLFARVKPRIKFVIPS